ncbi:MAG: single-stranded DNA-binding protein [Intestinibacter sp.]|uniref:single-stranded DNA-binding protein n=1 Tax=Intestinibacter sp. TaxID=1965304 RepID=UPI0025BE6358|nr:single-stranded DNA-binding protein [Intestinibacter sp.]MCI6737717.1 single-stranded DNA-binding protein [Intestinibacter sp.]
MNNVSLIGRLTSDPELKYVGNDTALCRFSIAVSRNYKNKDGVVPTDFINIEIWGRRAEIFCQYTSKGSLVGIEGSLRIEKYLNKEGENRTETKIHADNFHFLGSKNKPSKDNKLFNGDNLFENVLNEEEISEEEIPF